MEKRLKIASLAEQLSSIMTRIGEFREQVKAFQQKRQEDMWKFIKLAVSVQCY